MIANKTIRYIQSVFILFNVMKMKTLLILRHAKSKPKDPNLSDYDRTLDKLGKDDALRMGNLIRFNDSVPELIISSSAVRAKMTAEIVAEECKYEVGKIVLKRSLYRAKPEDYMTILGNLQDTITRVLLVGHNPTIEEAIEMLTDSSDVTMPSCTLTHLSIPIDKWSDLKKITNNQIVLKEKIQPY